MKKNIIKFLEKPTVVMSYTLVIAVVLGFIAYKTVGRAPELPTDIQSMSDTATPTTTLGTFTNGQEVSLAFPKGGRVSNVYVKAGDSVHKGQILANLASSDAQGAVSQASAQLEVAKANYDKILNGATSATIDVYKAAVDKTQANVDATKATQTTLVANAYHNLLNSNTQAVPANGITTNYTAPIITGSYNGDQAGVINLQVYYNGTNPSFSTSGLVSTTGTLSTITATPLGMSGLYAQLPTNDNQLNSTWAITLPNLKAANYLTNYNAYQAALSTQSQATQAALSDLNQAMTMLASQQSTARPEDVAVAKAQVDSATGALQIAEGQYSNNLISAPADGIITVVNIQPGEIAIMNQEAIGMIIKTN